MRDPELLRRRAANGSLPNLVIAGLTPSAMCRPPPSHIRADVITRPGCYCCYCQYVNSFYSFERLCAGAGGNEQHVRLCQDTSGAAPSQLQGTRDI